MTGADTKRLWHDRIAGVIEDSVESFIVQFRPFAAELELLPGIEGASLVACIANGKILHFLERTNPYFAHMGSANIILNPSASAIVAEASGPKQFEPLATSAIKAKGLVIERQLNALVIDAGIPFVVSSFGPVAETIRSGDWVSFESIAPMHGFILQPEKKIQYRREEAESDI